MRNLNWSIAASLALSLTATASAGAAEKPTGGLEEMTVTANKRKEDIQTVPLAVSAFSGATLEKLGLQSFGEAARFIPGLQILGSNVNRNTTVLIRGIGSSGTNPGIEPSVGIFLDGVFLPAAGPIQGNLLDIAAIETLRGPQGTLYGRNTSVGALNITTREPSSDRGGMIRATAGNYGTLGVSGYYGGSLTDEISARLSLWESHHDGYQKNLTTGGDSNDNTQWGARLRAKWAPNENFTNNFIGYYSRTLAHCCIPEPINPTGVGGIATPGFLAAAAAIGKPVVKLTSLDNTVGETGQGSNTTKVYGASNQADWTVFKDYTLTSITAYNAYDDKIPETVATGLPQKPQTNNQAELAEVYSEELRISSPKGQMIEFLAGAYFFHQDLTYSTQTSPILPDANRNSAAGRFSVNDGSVYQFAQKTDSQAVFGQATWNVAKSLRVTGGLRQSWEDKSGNTSTILNPLSSALWRSTSNAVPNTPLARKESKLTYMGTLQYDIADNLMAYATIATGFKSGGFNARASAPGTQLTFGPENSMNYELGLKSSFLDRRLVVNVDIYNLVEKGLQQSLLNPATGSGFIVGNVGNIKNEGLEFDAKFRVIEPLTLTATGYFNRAKTYNYTAGPCATFPGTVANGSRPGTCSFDGLRPSFNPSVTFSIGSEWRQAISDRLEGFVNLSGSYQGKQFEDATLDYRSLQRPFALINARVGVETQDGNWNITLFGKNLTGEAYYVATATQPTAAFMSAGGVTAPSGFVGWYGAPRTYGIEASHRF